MAKRDYNLPDLYWYFNDAESELGARAQQYEQQSKSTDGSHCDRSDAATKFARIDALVRSLSLGHQEILLRWYAIGHYPFDLKAKFKNYVGVVMLTKEVRHLAEAKNETIVVAFRSMCARAEFICVDPKCKASGHYCKSERQKAKNSIQGALLQAKRLVEIAHIAYEQQENKRTKEPKSKRKRRTAELLKIIR